MAIAHVCHRCGTDLARLRAQREKHYGLMIVRCPGCEAVFVRRRHPLVTTWRSLRRLDWSLTVLALNLFALGVLLAGTVGGIFGVVLETADRPLSELWNARHAGMMLYLVLWPIPIGIWLTVGLGHWRRRSAWLAFATLALFGLTIAALVDALHERAFGSDPSGWRADLEWLEQATDAWLRSATLLYMIMVAALAGVIPGRGLSWLMVHFRRALWRWRRRRAAQE
jgi:hypothetical protein